MKRVRKVLLLLVVGLFGYLIAWAQPYVIRPPLVVGQDAVSDAASGQARVSLEDVGGRTLSIRPPASEGTVLLVLYPGGLVRPQAYEWLGRALAEDGVQTVIPEFFADLAVTGKDRADGLIGRYAAERPVVIGGHSLGGAMAADYASRHADQLSGLILLAAYPASGVELTTTRFATLSLWAEHDQVANSAAVRAGMANCRRPAVSKRSKGRCTPSSDATGRNRATACRRSSARRRNRRSSSASEAIFARSPESRRECRPVHPQRAGRPTRAGLGSISTRRTRRLGPKEKS